MDIKEEKLLDQGRYRLAFYLQPSRQEESWPLTNFGSKLCKINVGTLELRDSNSHEGIQVALREENSPVGITLNGLAQFSTILAPRLKKTLLWTIALPVLSFFLFVENAIAVLLGASLLHLAIGMDMLANLTTLLIGIAWLLGCLLAFDGFFADLRSSAAFRGGNLDFRRTFAGRLEAGIPSQAELDNPYR